MRRILLAIATLIALPGLAAGPKMSNSGGIGSASSTFVSPGGELTGGSYTINGTTGAFTGQVGPASSILGDTGAISRTQDSRNKDVTRITDFCPASSLNGTADNTACIQAAVTAMCARTNAGGTLYLPAQYQYAVSIAGTGGYGISIPCSGLFIEGYCMGDHTHSGKATVINLLGTGNKYAFAWVVPSSQWRAGAYSTSGGMRNLVIVSANTPSSITHTGPMIDFEHCESCIVEGVRLWAPYIGLRVFSGLENRITQSQINQVVPGGTAILFVGSDSGCASVGSCATRADVLQIDHMIMDANFGSGSQSQPDCIHAQDFVQTLQVVATICNQFRRGLWADCPNSTLGQSACPGFISMFDFEAETNDRGQSDGFNVLLSDVSHFVCVDCQLFGYSVVNNVAALNSRYTQSGNIQLIGGRASYATQGCIVSSVMANYIAGVSVVGCGQSSAGSYGIDLRGNANLAQSGSNRVIGNNLCNETNGVTPTTMNGIILRATQDYNVVIGNVLRGCSTGYTDSSGGSHNSAGNNVGP